MEKESFLLYQEYQETFEMLSNEEAGILIKTIFEYQKTGVVPDIEKSLKIAFIPIKQNLDRNSEKWLEIKKKRSEAGKAGAEIKKQKQAKQANANFDKQTEANQAVNVNVNVNDNVIKKENIQRKKFIKPTVEEITRYCNERNNDVDAQRFYDFYESKGWKVGKESMKDWKACIRTWERSSIPKDNVKRLRSDKPPEYYNDFYDIK